MRLDKLLAHKGFGSRKDVKKIIKDKVVTVNDDIITNPASKVDIDQDKVMVKNEEIFYQKEVYYMLNKPAGYVCSHDAGLYPSALELIDNVRPDLIMVGRLDLETEGLLLITSDGKFSHQVSHGKKDIYKKYYVELEKDFNKSCIIDLESGITLDDEQLKPAKVEMLDSKSLLLSIAEGKYHQVKRMMHYCDNEVLYLRREQIKNLKLDENLEVGEYRQLTQEEINQFV